MGAITLVWWQTVYQRKQPQNSKLSNNQPHYLGLNQVEWFHSVITHLSHSTITGGSKNSGDKNIVPAEQIKFITCIIKEDNWSKHLKVSILRRITCRQTTFSTDSQIFFTFTKAYTFMFAVTYE